MVKETRIKLDKASKEKIMMLISTKKGLIKITHHKNVMIVETKRQNLFVGSPKIALRSDLKVAVGAFSHKIAKDTIGYLKDGRVYFQVELGFLGLGKDYLEDNTNYIIPNLC